MKVYTDIGHLPAFRNAVVTIGTFDGVHLGHQKIIGQLKAEAARVHGETVIITFHPHPRKVVAGTHAPVYLLTTIEERIEQLSGKGIDHLVIVPFTTGFSEIEPNRYVTDFLVAKFKPAVVIIGYDHKFGKNRAGDYKLLEHFSAQGLFELKEISEQLINDVTVSSTLIRKSLKEGNVSKAKQLLGYPFYFFGKVVQGDQRGRTIGYPTANLLIENPDKILPANGVYAVDVQLEDGRVFKGMMNIGLRPTVDGSKKTIEVNILDFEGDLYGQQLRVALKGFIRQEKKFSGLEELKMQLALDKKEAAAY